MKRDLEQAPVVFSREVVIAQLAARAALRRSLAVIVLSLVGWLAVGFIVLSQLGLPDDLWAALTLGPALLAVPAIRQAQWWVLASHRLRCPSCRHLLAENRHWWKSPTPFCKACGKLALLPVAALERAAAT
ncbi:hypothetical protein [Thermomonas haemolytica]|uniref:hypothetical protein n=1 Tax=Thermomonas haemolytica TaxID=141949 RepID=UPI00104FD402|nr:hypothetical protein [Thermomonas haemolytica]